MYKNSCEEPLQGTHISLMKLNPSEEEFGLHWKAEEVNEDVGGFSLNVAEILVEFAKPAPPGNFPCKTKKKLQQHIFLQTVSCPNWEYFPPPTSTARATCPNTPLTGTPAPLLTRLASTGGLGSRLSSLRGAREAASGQPCKASVKGFRVLGRQVKEHPKLSLTNK